MGGRRALLLQANAHPSASLFCDQRKRTAHERAKELFASGEFSSGRKWADDAPKEKLDTNTVNLIASGACGAFVHGLEDEMFGTEHSPDDL